MPVSTDLKPMPVSTDFLISATPCDGHVLVKPADTQADVALYRGTAAGGSKAFVEGFGQLSSAQGYDDVGSSAAGPVANGTTYFYQAVRTTGGSNPATLTQAQINAVGHSNEASAMPQTGLSCQDDMSGDNSVPVPTLTATARLTANVPDVLLEGE